MAHTLINPESPLLQSWLHGLNSQTAQVQHSACQLLSLRPKGLGSIDAFFGLIFKMADVTRFNSTRFVNYKKGVFNSLHGWLPWQRAYFEDYCFEAIRHVSLRC